jgi:microcystin-dependent protein
MNMCTKTAVSPIVGKCCLLLLGAALFAMGTSEAAADPPNAFAPGDLLTAEALNENFAALAQATNPPGTILAYAGAEAPPGWLPCDGTLLDSTKAENANLYARIGVSYGGSATSGMFNLPDLRGRFLRGWDDGAGQDPDAADREPSAEGGNEGDAVGTLQHDMVGQHTHQSVGLNPVAKLVTTDFATFSAPDALGTTGTNEGNETRPVNVAVNFIIKL